MATAFELYERRLAQEISARKQAESLLENKKRELLNIAAQDRQPAEIGLRENEEHYQLLVELSPDAILIEIEGRVIYANTSAVRLFRAQDPSELLGYQMRPLAWPHYRLGPETAYSPRQDGICNAVEEQVVRLDGSTIQLAVTRISFIYQNKPATQIIARDISERKRLETQLNYLATHDTLTGLPNRNLLMDRLHQAIVSARRYERRFVLAFIDLDRFKWINDSLGHEAGDALLKTVSHRMSACLRESDTIARIGGDEFVVLMQETGDYDESMQVIKRLVESISLPITLDGRELAITCSVGCSTYPDDGWSGEALLKCADTAMYSAKETGRNHIRIYDTELRGRIDKKVKLETDLRHAIQRKELILHYQPQINLITGDIMGVEALLRWQHPELGSISPAEFIPIAEDTGLIMPIGQWVIRQACCQNKAWQQAGLPPIRMAVNLSPRQLSHPGLEDFIAECLSSTALDPSYLELEFTESASMDDPIMLIPLMHRLKKLGVSLSIDDFGTGYSNMKYLKSFPIDTLKLDGSFVREITSDPRSLSIADAIIAMSHRLGLKVVAEMAETKEQVMLLTAHGCDQVQGFYFSQPVPAKQCMGLLRAGMMTLPVWGLF